MDEGTSKQARMAESQVGERDVLSTGLISR